MSLVCALLNACMHREQRYAVSLSFLSSSLGSSLTATFSPALSSDEFLRFIESAPPSLFARGNVHYVRRQPDLSWCFATSDLLQTDTSHLLDVAESKTFKAQLYQEGDIVIDGLTDRDSIERLSFNEEAVLKLTALGNRRPPVSQLELKHVGEPRIFKGRWELESFRDELQSQKTRIQIGVPDSNFVRGRERNANANVALWACYGKNYKRVRIYRGSIVIPTDEAITRMASATLQKVLPVRLQRKTGYYIDVELDKGFPLGPVEELPQNFRTVIGDLIAAGINALSLQQSFVNWRTQAIAQTIEEEELTLRVRKQQARASRKVQYARGGTRKLTLYREPKNEQDVVILTSLLAQHGAFPVFELLDYDASKGIDAIARVKLTPMHGTDEDAVVEFKHRAEGFLNELHPLTLVNLIIAWDGSPKQFEGTDYRFVQPNKARSWLWRLESLADGASAEVVLLKFLDGLKVIST